MADKKLKIKMLRGAAGTGFDGEPFTFAAGGVYEVSEELAKDLCRTGEIAELLGPAKQPDKTTRKNG